jgi:hypothetical protein
MALFQEATGRWNDVPAIFSWPFNLLYSSLLAQFATLQFYITYWIKLKHLLTISHSGFAPNGNSGEQASGGRWSEEQHRAWRRRQRHPVWSSQLLPPDASLPPRCSRLYRRALRCLPSVTVPPLLLLVIYVSYKY